MLSSIYRLISHWHQNRDKITIDIFILLYLPSIAVIFIEFNSWSMNSFLGVKYNSSWKHIKNDETDEVCLFVWVQRRFETSEVITRRCLLVAVVLWQICCHTGMPCRRHRTWHPTPSQYTDTGPTCRCAIHRCGTSHWNTQLPILMSWVRPDREILPRPSTHTRERSTWCCHGGQQSEAQ